MKPKIIIFLLLLAGVGTQPKAQGTPPVSHPITFMNERGEQTFGLVSPQDPLIEGIVQFKNWASEWLITCIKGKNNIICPVSPHQLQQIKSGILTVLVGESLGEPPFSLALRGATIGAIAVGILAVCESMYKVLPSPKDNQRAREAKLPMYHSDEDNQRAREAKLQNTADVRSRLPIRHTMYKVTVGALLGAGVGAIAELLDRSPQPVAVYLHVSGGDAIPAIPAG